MCYVSICKPSKYDSSQHKNKATAPLLYHGYGSPASPVRFASESIAILSLYNSRAAHTTADAKCSKTLV